METQNSRRILDRSRDPGLKKRRLAEDPTLSLDRTSNGRTTFMQQRPATSALASSRRLSGDSEKSDAVRGLHPQLQNQHLEILDEYKTALRELTFNSKPIITNLTIIAGENLDAAKAIAAIVSSHILEVPSEQKLPSLYLLDSIVKNIGKDYIKYFGFKLPEVFCKAYRQVDPSIHNGMRHLFGTWKGVFPPQPLQAIEKELGFAPAVNKLPSGTTSRLDTPASRPAHSIHVNPKYLEAQQRLQHSNKSSQHTQKEGNDVFRTKSISAPFGENGYDSDISKQFDEKFNGNVRGTVSTQRNGIDGKQGIQIPLNKKRPPNHGLTSQSTIPMIGSWKNSDEEEYTWDCMNSRVGDHNHAATAARDHWPLDDSEKTSEASGDSLSRDTEMIDQAVFGSLGSSLWSEEPPFPETERMRSFAGRTIPGLSESNKVSGEGLTTSYTANGRTSFPSKVAPPASIGSSVYGSSKSLTSGFTVSVAPQKEAFLEVASPSAQSLLYPRDLSSPTVHSVPLHNTTQQDEPQARIRPESRSSQFSGSHNIDPRTKFGQESSGNIHLLNQRVQSRNTPSSLSAKPSQLKQHTSVSQQPEHEPLLSDLSRQVQKPFSRALSSTSSLPNDPDPLPLPSSGQLSTNSLLAAVNGILNSQSVALTSQTSTLPPFPSVPQTQPVTTNPSSSKLAESANVTNTNTPVSSLLSSLLAKGLILASNAESTPDTSYKPAQPQNRSPERTRSGSSQAPPIPLVSLPISAPSSAKSVPASTEMSSVQQADDMRNHIGFEFKGNVLRVLHPAVISSLFDDFPHKCKVCEGRVKNQDQVARHLEWHALRNRESNSNKASRVWYADAISMLAANAGNNMSVDELSGPQDGPEFTEPMVPADESQCLCILCGEIFEDYYDKGMDQWMFKGAVYANVPCFDGIRNQHEVVVGQDCIVHEKCISQQV